MVADVRSTSATGNDANEPELSSSVPSGAAAGDVMVAFLSRWVSGGPSAPVITPAGFTHVGQYPSGNGNAAIDVFWKRLTEADSGNYVFAWGENMWSSVEIACVTGAISTGDPIAGIDAWAGNAGTFGATSVTTDAAPVLLWNSYNDEPAQGGHTPPSGFTEAADYDCGSLAWRVPGTAGTHTATGGSVATSGPATAVLVAVLPEPDTISPASVETTIPVSLALNPTTAARHVVAASIPLAVSTDPATTARHEVSTTIDLTAAVDPRTTAEVVPAAEVATVIPLSVAVAPTTAATHEVSTAIPLTVALAPHTSGIGVDLAQIRLDGSLTAAEPPDLSVLVDEPPSTAAVLDTRDVTVAVAAAPEAVAAAATAPDLAVAADTADAVVAVDTVDALADTRGT